MKGIFKLGFKLYGKVVLATVMAFFIVISVNVIATGLMSEETGYKAYGVKEESQEQELLYEYSNSDGEDTQKEKYEEQGYTITTEKIYRIKKSGVTFFHITSQFFSLMILTVFIYSFLWKVGTKDNNLARFGHITADKFRGFKIGLVACIPYAVFVLALFVLRFIARTNVSTALIEFLNSHIYSFTSLVLGENAFLDISFIRLFGLLLLGLIVPIISGISYLIGFKDIAIGEKILYKKKKN